MYIFCIVFEVFITICIYLFAIIRIDTVRFELFCFPLILFIHDKTIETIILQLVHAG